MEHNISNRVCFVKSFSDDERTFLFRHATVLLYTPPNEHFGIVPVEAMFSRLPGTRASIVYLPVAHGTSKLVVACDSGGPRESVVDGVTGRLTDCDAVRNCSVLVQ